MTKFKVNGYNDEAVYYDTAEEAQTALVTKQAEVLIKEAVRFSICATFVDGNNTTWREVQESDPEDTICQVFDTFTGTYTEVPNKTEAYALNAQKQQSFLASVGLDKVYEEDPPAKMPQPVSEGTQTL